VDKIPSHVPVYISNADIPLFKEYLSKNGYYWTILQVIKPKQIHGSVKKIERKERLVENHVRIYIDGRIESEFEVCRVQNMWEHLTTCSYSAHEYIIELLDKLGIHYTIDQNLRTFYNENAADDYPKDNMEFFRWLFGGVIVWTPLGLFWRVGHEIKNLFRGKNLNKNEELSSSHTLSD